MKVIATSNLVSSETGETTTACNFQHDYAMRGQYKYEAKNIEIWSYSVSFEFENTLTSCNSKQ